MGLLLVSICIVAVAGWITASGYNRIVTLARRCDQAIADVDVQVRHRHDLIPNLVEVVRGLSNHERGIVEQLMQSRSQAIRAESPAERERAESVLGVQLGQLIAVVEGYPEAEASQHFAGLRRDIADSENKIAAARRFQNMAVAEYNASIEQFPLNLIASRCGLRTRRSYDLGLDLVFAEEAPTVKF